MTKERQIDPGPRATPEVGRRAWQEVVELIGKLEPLNIPYAAAHIRAHPPSPEAIATLAFYGHEWLKTKQTSQAATGKHARTPVGLAKMWVSESWREWQTGRLTYRNRASFVRDMKVKEPLLKTGMSSRLRLIGQLRRQNRALCHYGGRSA